MKYFYACSPQDCWPGWLPENQIKPTDKTNEYLEEYGIWDYEDNVAFCKDKWKEIGWEGDGEIRLAGLPCDSCDGHYVLSVKQGNDGLTFYASPVPLSFLEYQEKLDPETEAQQYLREQKIRWQLLLDKTESPMEKKLLIIFEKDFHGIVGWDESKTWLRFTYPDGDWENGTCISIIPQWPVKTSAGNYRLDFSFRAFTNGGWEDFDVEVDGKDYHSTIESINADHERTQALLGQGINVLRFSGEDVYHNAELVALKIVRSILKKINETQHDKTI
jgi:very-short-patch-repair endonuclease